MPLCLHVLRDQGATKQLRPPRYHLLSMMNPRRLVVVSHRPLQLPPQQPLHLRLQKTHAAVSKLLALMHHRHKLLQLRLRAALDATHKLL